MYALPERTRQTESNDVYNLHVTYIIWKLYCVENKNEVSELFGEWPLRATVFTLIICLLSNLFI